MEDGRGGLFGSSSGEGFGSYSNLVNVQIDDNTFQLENSKIMGKKYLPEESEDIETGNGLDDLFYDLKHEMADEHGFKTIAVVYNELAEQAEDEGYVNGKRVYDALEELDTVTDELEYLVT